MLSQDEIYWMNATKEELKSNAVLWSKTMSTKKLEAFIDWYGELQDKIFIILSEEEKRGLVTEKTQEIHSLHNRRVTALIARFMRKCHKEEIPEYLYK